MKTEIRLSVADGLVLNVSHYKVDDSAECVILAPAVGIPQGFYSDFALYLKGEGFSVITFDYSGTGDATTIGASIRLQDWGSRDVEGVITYAREELSYVDVHYVGHSIGGQIVGLAPSSNNLKSIVMIAASAPYWRRWSFPMNLKMLATSKALIPIFAFGRSQFPAKSLGLGVLDFPAVAAKDWANWMAHEDYLFSKEFGLQTEIYAQISCPILGLGFTDDELAPKANVEKLLSFFPRAKINCKQISPESAGLKGIGHSGFFKRKNGDELWPAIICWLRAA